MQRSEYIGFKTIVGKEIRRFMNIWPQTIIPAVITTALYFLIFGQLVGQRIGLMGGVSYTEYIAPGLIMMSVINNAYANVSTSFFMAKFLRYIEEILVSPIPNYLILLGFIAGGVARAFAVGLVVAATALFFTRLPIHNIFCIFLAVFLASTIFSIAGFINGLLAKKFDGIAIIPTFILTPLTYLGGVFFSVDLLTGFWKKIAHVNPILYFINIFRYGMLGISEVNVGMSFLILTLILIALYLVALMLFTRGVGIRT